MPADLIARGRYVVTSCDSAQGEIEEDAAVAIDGGRVVAVDRADALIERHPEAEVIGSDRHLVIPGLINSHHHGWGLSPLQLGAADGLLEHWLIDLISLPHLDHYNDILFAASKMIRSGVTTVQHSGISRDFGALAEETDQALRAYEASGMRVAYAVQFRNRNSYVYEDDEKFLARLDPETAERLRSATEAMGGATVEECEAIAREMVQRYRDHDLIKVLLCAEGPEWCDDDLLRRLRLLADELAVGIHLHCLESPYQREYLRREYGDDVVSHLDDIGLLGPDVSLAHAVWLTEREMELCREREVSICHNPSSNLRLQVGISPVTRMMELGVNVALGMDSTGLNDDEDMLFELGLAARLHRAPRSLGVQWAPDAVDALRMATSNAAAALGMDGRIGRLKEGYEADLVLLDYDAMTAPFTDPGVSPIDVLVGRGRARHVESVVVGGKALVSQGELVDLDQGKVAADLAASAERPQPERVREWAAVLEEVKPEVERFYAGWDEPEYRPSYIPNSLD